MAAGVDGDAIEPKEAVTELLLADYALKMA